MMTNQEMQARIERLEYTVSMLTNALKSELGKIAYRNVQEALHEELKGLE
jgi:hypothetical protein